MKKPTKSRGISSNAQKQALVIPGLESLAKEIDEQLSSVIADEKDRKAVVTKIAKVTIEERYSGPIPSPHALELYERVLSGSANRFMLLAEKGLEGQINIAKTRVSSEALQLKLGMVLGFLALCGLVVGAIYAGMHGKDALSYMLVGAAALGVVERFILGKVRSEVKKDIPPN